jgi:type IX secretion system PorP/SprF family membrane protein
MKKGLIFILLVVLNLGARSQDVHFSHFFSMPIFHNPAFTGYMKGDVRAAADFKLQYEGFGDGFGNAYRTTAAAVDFGLLRKQTNGSTLGVGATFVNDKAGDLGLSTNSAGLAVSYVLALDQDRSNYLGVGFHGTFNQRSIDFTNAIFPDVAETDFLGNYKYFNLSAGLLWFFEPNEDINFYLGAALHNIFTPNVSFEAGVNEDLDRRITAQLGSSFNLSKRFSLVPSVIFQKQGPSQELVLGTFFKYKFGGGFQPTDETNVQLGLFYRFADAIVPVARVDYKAVSFIFSYDVNISKLTPASNLNGGPEVSLVYQGRIFPESSKYSKLRCPIL